MGKYLFLILILVVVYFKFMKYSMRGENDDYSINHNSSMQNSYYNGNSNNSRGDNNVYIDTEDDLGIYGNNFNSESSYSIYNKKKVDVQRLNSYIIYNNQIVAEDEHSLIDINGKIYYKNTNCNSDYSDTRVIDGSGNTYTLLNHECKKTDFDTINIFSHDDDCIYNNHHDYTSYMKNDSHLNTCENEIHTEDSNSYDYLNYSDNCYNEYDNQTSYYNNECEVVDDDNWFNANNDDDSWY